MKLPRPASIPGRSISAPPITRGIVPAVTLEERNGAQAFINGNCHGLQQCNGATPCNVAFARGQLANQCAHARFTVRSYYIERDIPDPGNHQGAIVWDDNVAQSCLAQVQSPRCQVRG